MTQSEAMQERMRLWECETQNEDEMTRVLRLIKKYEIMVRQAYDNGMPGTAADHTFVLNALRAKGREFLVV